MRDHRKPVQCFRCWEELDPSIEAQVAHAAQNPACEQKPQRLIVGITEEIWKEYLSKTKELTKSGGKGASAVRMTDAARWRILYKVVFPDENPIPSPCS
jgi:hypothetical protein